MKVTKALTFSNGQSVWDKLKSKLFKGLDEQDYKQFQEVRHDPDLFGKESKSKEKTINVNRDLNRLARLYVAKAIADKLA